MRFAQKKWEWFALRLILLGVILIFLGQTLVAHWTTVRRAAVNLEGSHFVLAVILFFLVLSLMPLPTYLALRMLSKSASFREASAMYFASQGAKYLPGGLWAIPGRVYLYHRRLNIPKLEGTFSVGWELLTLAAAALLVGFAGRSLPGDMALLPVWMLVLTGSVIVLGGVQRVLAGRFANREWVMWIGKYTRAFFIFPTRTLVGMTAGAALFWVLAGLAFYSLLGSAVEAKLSIHWYEATGAFALAWLAGFLVIILPAGLGVRESVLVMLLAPWFTPGEAVFVAVLARLWWVLAEAVWIIIGWYWLRLPPD